MTNVGEIPFEQMDGTTATLADHRGEAVLVVNVASKCGLTPQYEALQQLYADRHDDGLTIVGFPANNFGGQEPGSNDEIAEFCTNEYSVTFPVMSKISVLGDDQHPLYRALTDQIPGAEGKAEFRETLKGH